MEAGLGERAEGLAQLWKLMRCMHVSIAEAGVIKAITSVIPNTDEAHARNW